MTGNVISRMVDDSELPVQVLHGPDSDQEEPGASLAKADEGAVGDHRARHLIRWFNEGADGRIHWGQHGHGGDFDQCVIVASEHMSPEQAKGFCAERHHDTTGKWPGADHNAVAKTETVDD